MRIVKPGDVFNSEREKALIPIDKRIYYAGTDLDLPAFENAFGIGYRVATDIISAKK